MRLFVTGGSGFIGSYAVAALLARGHEARLLVRSPDKARTVLGTLGVDADRVELVTGDMVDRRVVEEAVGGCHATLHAAAAIGMTGRGQPSVLELNTVGARTVVEAALAAGHDPVVHLSSVAIFVPPAEPTIRAESPLASPRTDYGRSKLVTEQELRRLQDGGAPITIMYPGGVLGPDQPALDTSAEGIVGARTQGWPKTAGGTCIIDVRDLAEAIAAAMVPGQGPRRFVLGGRFYNWADFGALLDELTGVRARRLPLPPPVLHSFAWLLDGVRRMRPVAYPLTRDAAQMMTAMVPTDDQPALDALGVELRPTAETLTDTVRWLVAAGHLPADNAGKLVNPG
jgi:nucleoside-diphosphate-sugar epimerase